MTIRFELVSEGDQEAIVQYLASRQRRMMTLTDWRWEFARYPQLAVSTFAMDGNRIIGSQAMLPIYLNQDGEVLLTSKSEASYLDTEYRGDGNFERLYRFAEKRCAERRHLLIWGFTSAARVWKESLKFDLVTPCIQEVTVGLGARWRFLSSLPMRLTSQKLNIEAKARSAADIAELYQKIRKNFSIRIHLEMNFEYLNWRISNNPNLNYVTEYLYSSGELVGFYAYSMQGRVAKVAEIAYKEADYAVSSLKALTASVVRRNASTLYYFGNEGSGLNAITFRTCQAWGGAKAPCTWANLVVKRTPLYTDDDIFDPDLWHLNGLWTEGISL